MYIKGIGQQIWAEMESVEHKTYAADIARGELNLVKCCGAHYFVAQ